MADFLASLHMPTLAEVQADISRRRQGAQGGGGVEPPPIPTQPTLREPGGAPAPGEGQPPPNGASFGGRPQLTPEEAYYGASQQIDPALVKTVMGLGPQDLEAERAKATVAALRGGKPSDRSARYGQRGGVALALGDGFNNFVDAYKLKQAERGQEESETRLGAAKVKAGEDFFAEANRGRSRDGTMPASKFQLPVTQKSDDLKLDPELLAQFQGLDLSKMKY